MNIRLLRICSIPIRIKSPELHVSDTCFLHELHIMERYVTTTYRLHNLHIYSWGWYLTTAYHLYTDNEDNVLYVLEFYQSWVFSLLTTSVVCPSVQGATVHKARRRAATEKKFKKEK